MFRTSTHKILVFLGAIILIIALSFCVPDTDNSPDNSPAYSSLTNTTASVEISREDLYKRTLDYVHNASRSSSPSFHEPSPSLKDRALHEHPDNEPQTIDWLREASKEARRGKIIRASRRIIRGIREDRTLLAFLFPEIDAVAFPIAQRLLAADHVADAHKLLSLCAVASGMPVAYLRELMTRLSADEAALLWDKDPLSLIHI